MPCSFPRPQSDSPGLKTSGYTTTVTMPPSGFGNLSDRKTFTTQATKLASGMSEPPSVADVASPSLLMTNLTATRPVRLGLAFQRGDWIL